MMNPTGFLLILARSSVEAGVLVVLVLVTQWLFRKNLTPRWHCMLWMLVLVRLVPFSLSSAASVFNLAPHLPKNASFVLRVIQHPGVEFPVKPETAVLSPTQSSSEATRPNGHALGSMDLESKFRRPDQQAAPRSQPFRWSASLVLFMLWAAGATCLLVPILFTSFRFSRRFRDAKAVTDPAALGALREACDRLDVRRAPRIIESDAVPSPALHGLFRPTLLLPSGFVSVFSLHEIGFVFLHELAHLKRRDLALNWAATLLQVVHWFNPLIWLGLARWRVDREIACDALALEVRGTADHLDYGRTILRLVDHGAVFTRSPGLVGILENRKQLRRRIGMIATYVPRPRWSLVGVLALGVLAVIGLTDAQEDKVGIVSTKADTGVHSPAREHSAEKSRSLKITVLDANTDQPVEGANVVAWALIDNIHPTAEKGPGERTDAKGEVVFSVPLGKMDSESEQTFQVAVSHPKFAPREVMWIAADGNVRETLDNAYVIRIQPGVTVGGFVRDEQGQPIVGVRVDLSGSDYRGFTSKAGTMEKQEYASLNSRGNGAATTDERGFWQCRNVPTDLARIHIVVTRQGGAQNQFVTPAVKQNPNKPVPQLSNEDLKAQTAILTLTEGRTLRGTVTDEAGRPLDHVLLRVRDAERSWGSRTFDSTIDGAFELPHWTAAGVIVTAERDGYATTSVTLKTMIDMPEAHLVMPKAKGLKVRVLGENDAPVAQAEFRIVEYRSGEQLLDWQGATDAAGRVEWRNAPERPITLAIISKDYPARTIQVSGDGSEHVVRLKKSEDQQITVALRAIDAQTGQPLEHFDVFRRINESYELWNNPGSQGAFKAELLHSVFPNGYTPTYRVQVRASGYGIWTSDRLEFSDGDQQLTAKLTKGYSPPDDSSSDAAFLPNTTSGETDPSLLVLGAAVAQLIETEDVSAFVHALSPTLEDWRSVLPAGIDLAESPLGKHPASKIASYEKKLTASALRVLELSRHLGLEKGRLRLTAKTVTGPSGGTVYYDVGGKKLELPWITRLQVVLTTESLDQASSNQETPGDFALQLGGIVKFPKGWRVEEGVRWFSFPPAMADEGMRRDLELTNRITPTDFHRVSSPITGSDDETLNQLAGHFAELLQHRDEKAFALASTLSRKDLEEFLVNQVGQSASAVDKAYQEMNTSAATAAASLLNQIDDLGINLSDAKIAIKRVTATSPWAQEFGSLEGTRAPSVQIALTIDSTRVSKTGVPLSGDYTITVEDSLRAGGRWILPGSRVRWQEFPPGLLSKKEIESVAFENYIAEHHVLPPGAIAPDIDLVRLPDQTSTKLSAFRGKVVILDFWASWCGPCQEPMREMQKLAALHPEWKDRVEIVTVSIDNKAQDASEHIAKRGWSKTLNTWAGDGGFKSSPAQAFRVNGVPTTYVLGIDGKIIMGGHPEGMDFATIVNSALR